MIRQTMQSHSMTGRFPRHTFKALSGASISLAIFLLLITIYEVIHIHNAAEACRMQKYDTEQRCYVVSLPYPEIVGACYIFYASLLIITSCVGFATATTKLGHRQGGLKTGYIILNIINAFLYTMILMFSGVLTLGLPPPLLSIELTWLACIAGVLSALLCVVAALVSCCCAPVSQCVHPPVALPYPTTQLVNIVPPGGRSQMSYQSFTPEGTGDKVQLIQHEETKPVQQYWAKRPHTVI